MGDLSRHVLTASPLNLVADLTGSLDLLLDEAAAMPVEGWTALVPALAGWRHPAWFTLPRCRRELETHHVDLKFGYSTANWTAECATWALDDTLTALTGPHFPPPASRPKTSAEPGTFPRPAPPSPVLATPCSPGSADVAQTRSSTRTNRCRSHHDGVSPGSWLELTRRSMLVKAVSASSG
ncbi:hypothetical protein [Streptomyces sp. NPDC059649]|uniref:hypothetical protein n=1 Tax=Streptomyces sp. NPDC059649 TaxID=3346895 RepID=UPI0036A44C47